MSVAERSPEAQAMLEAAMRHRALYGGTKAMRKAGEKYLPKNEAEELKDYQARLDRSFLFNAYRKTVKDMSGKVFMQPVTLNEDNATVAEWVDNIDLQGQHLTNFAQAVMRDGMQAGISYILVDAPRREGQVTQLQARTSGLRPYFVHLMAEDILGWKTTVVNNQTVLSQLRFMESVSLPDPDDEFKEMRIPQVRVMDRLAGSVNIRLFRKDGTDKWVMVEEYAIPVPEIRVAPFYANRSAFFMGEPVLEDLADLNVAHWQSSADQTNILHISRVPILFMKGIEDMGRIVAGPHVAITTSELGADVKYVEIGGDGGIAHGRQSLLDIELQMQVQGLQLLVKQDSATGAMLDASKETSQLGQIADNLEDCLNLALSWLCDFGGQEEVTCSVHKDFDALSMTGQELTFLLQAVNTGNMTKERFLIEVKRRGVVADDMDVDAELEALEAGQMPEPDAERNVA